MQTPKLGMIIGYRLTDDEMKDKEISSLPQNPVIGHIYPTTKIVTNNHQEVAPAIITSVYPGEYGEGIEGIGVNCRVFFDSEFMPIWKTSLKLGQEKGQYYFID